MLSPFIHRSLVLGCSLFLLSLASTGLWAQPKPVDLQDRETTLSEQSFAAETLPLKVDTRFLDQQFQKSDWKGRTLRWKKHRARLVVEASEEKQRVPLEVKTLKHQKPEKAPSSWTRPVRGQAFYERKQPQIAPLVREANVTDGYLGKTAYQSIVGQLSMSDINRFQFQKNHSREPGLPRIPAGGSNPVEEKP